MDDIFVYDVKLPPHVNEMVVPCLDGYTVYIDISLTEEARAEAYNHALEHIKNQDWDNDDVNSIESKTVKSTSRSKKDML